MQTKPSVFSQVQSAIIMALCKTTSLVLLIGMLGPCLSFPARADKSASALQHTLSQEDKNWLATHPVIRLGIDPGYAPYSFIDDKGHFQGLVRDYLDYLGPALGVRFEIIPSLDGSHLMAAVQARQIDAVATFDHLPEWDDFLEFSDIYIFTPRVILTRTDTPPLRSLDELAKLNLTLVADYSSSKRVMKQFPQLQPRHVARPLDGLTAVSSGLADAYVGVLGVSTYLAAQHGLSNLKVNAAFDMEINGQRFGVRKDWPQLARILDQGLAGMPAQTKNRIFQTWLPIQAQNLHLMSPPTALPYAVPWLVVPTIIALLAYLATAFRNRQLARELTRHKVALDRTQTIAHLGYWSIDFSSGLFDLSDELFRIFGRAPVEPDWPTLRKWIHVDDRLACDAYLDRLRTIRQGESMPRLTPRIQRPDGSLRWIDVACEVEFNAQGKPVQFYGTALDITGVKGREAELKHLHSILNALVEGSTDAICVKNVQGQYIVGNQALASLLGYPIASILGKDDYALFATESAERFRADDQRILNTGKTETYEECVATPHASYTYLTTKGPLVIDGEIHGIFVIARDITQRKQDELSLQNSESRLRLFIEHAPAALAMFDRDMNYIAVSRRWLTDYQLERSDIIGESHYAIFPDLPEHWKAIHQRGLAGELVRNKQDRFERADGSLQWLSWEIRPWFAADSSVGGIVIFSEDITERILMEQSLRESEGRFTATFEQAAVGIAIVSPEGRWMRVNHKICAIVGYSEAELLSLTFQDITHADDLDIDLEHVRQMLAHEIDTYSMEKRYLRKDGDQVWVNLTVSLIWKTDGDPDYFISVIEDISARKAVEFALHESEAHFRLLFEQNPVPMLVYERGSLRMLAVNEAFVRHYGYSHDEVSTRLLTDLYPDEEKQAITDLAASLTGLAYVGEWHHVKKDGSRITIETRSHDIDFEGRRARVAVITDITERKQMEHRLREQLDELTRWQAIILGREDRVQALKAEVNDLLSGQGHPIRYPSQAKPS